MIGAEGGKKEKEITLRAAGNPVGGIRRNRHVRRHNPFHPLNIGDEAHPGNWIVACVLSLCGR